MPCLESWNGCANCSACTDGALAGTKLLCASLATSAIPGKARTAMMVTTTQANATGQRKRIEKRPIALTMRLITSLPSSHAGGYHAATPAPLVR